MSQQELIARWIRPEVAEISAYHVPPAQGMIKLDAMENPYDWPEELKAEWAKQLQTAPMNRYPDPTAHALMPVLRDAMQVPDGMSVLLGNGSDELIQMLALALAGPERVMLSVEPSFVMYQLIARFAGMPYVGVPLRAQDFSLDLAAVLAAIEQHQPALVFLAYPNNPTGNLFAASEVEQIIRVAPGLVVVDEAYAPFTDASFMARLAEFENLLVMRTISKMGFAGLRLGLLAGSPAWLEQLDKVRMPYNINVLTQMTAAFALQHKAVFDAQTQAIRKARGELYRALCALPGLQVYPSHCNFLLVRFGEGKADAWHQALREQGILVKKLHGSHPMLAECLRLTVGTADENAAMLKVLSQLAKAIN